jgi:Xaa-Pro aminopeptidase
MEKRVDKLLKKMGNIIEAFYITNLSNIRYISGFTGSSAYLYVSKSRQILLTDFRYIEQAENECDGFRIVDYTKEGLYKTLVKLAEEDGVTTLAFEGEHLRYEEFQNLSHHLLPITTLSMVDFIEEIRMVKAPEELENIKKAAAIADKAFLHILDYIKPGMRETEIALELEYFMKLAGAEKLSFDTIVASGVHSAMPHASPTRKKVEKGDFITMDFGCVYQGYCSDMTRTIVIGKAKKGQKKIYKTVLKAQEQALEQVKAGMLASDLDGVAREIIEEKYKGYFGHGLGHGVGLDIHEAPRISPKGDVVLAKGMVITIEPGIYIPEFGGVRIEDLIVVTKKNCKNYTVSEKKLIEL